MANLQIEKFKSFPLGFEFIPEDGNRIPRKKEAINRMQALGKNTCHLFLYAIEKSGSGPPGGVMHLDETTKSAHPGGIHAFLRAVERYLPTTFIELNSIKEHMKIHKIEHVYDNKVVPKYESSSSTAHEGEMEICKVPVNPMLILLHVDQGSFTDGQYTPFATPKANNQSIYEENVDQLIEKLLSMENVIKTEDFSIVPYMIHLEDTLKAKRKKTALQYRCTLDRDKHSQHIIMAKEAQLITSSELKLANKVSDNNQKKSYHVMLLTPAW
jgi:hypothetical protein